MRICLVAHEYPPDSAHGGIGTQTWNKARALAGLGHEVQVVTAAADTAAARTYVEDDGVVVHRLEPPGFEFSLHAPPAYWLAYSLTVWRCLERLVETVGFDVVDVPEYGAEGFGFQLNRTRWNPTPVVVQLHGPTVMFGERIGWPDRNDDLYRVVGWMEGYSISHADALMACSANIADFVSEHYGVSRDDIDVVHCGVDLGAFGSADRSENGRPTVLFVGNVAANKGIDIVCDAVIALREKYPDILLRIVGRGEDDFADELMERVEAAGAVDNVHFDGFLSRRDQLPDCFRTATVFASPAQHEVGVANVYIEAMAAACPVVAAETGGAPEAVVDGRSGLLVPPQDVAATAAALDLILGDADLRRRMGSAGRARVEEYFAMDRYVERVLATYQRAIDRQEGAPE